MVQRVTLARRLRSPAYRPRRHIRSSIHPRNDVTPIHLPLTEDPSEGPLRAPGITPEIIGAVVDDFYAECRRDRTLGPIFERQVQDWDEHLARIRTFWSAALLRTGGYSGRPLEAHLAVPGLASEHFSIWLRLFRQTLARHCQPADAAAFLSLAGRMANTMMNHVNVGGARKEP